MSISRTAFSLGFAAFVLSCGGGQTQELFDASWVNDQGVGIGDFQKRFAAEKVPTGADVAVGVVGNDTLVGVALAGGTPWTFKHAMTGRPAVAGGVVVGLGAGELFALEAKTGKPLWTRSAEGSLRGIGDDGSTTVVSLVDPSGVRSTLLAISRDGSVIRQVEDETPIGVPAVVGRYVFVPWKGQYVSVFDLTAGEEVARALLRTQTSQAFVAGGAVFFGEAGVTRFDENIRMSSQGSASTVDLPLRELPGKPKWMSSGIEATPLAPSARDNILLLARPTATDALTISGQRFAATYFRIALGMSTETGEIAWAHTNPAEFVGGSAYDGGFALCDTDGKVTFLSGKTGGVAGSISLGRKIDSCTVHTDGFSQPDAPASGSLASQLSQAIQLPEAQHVMIQRLLLREMASLTDPEASKVLIELASNPQTSPVLLADARKALSARRTGEKYLLEALSRHYDFLGDVLRPPPVGPIADALAAMNKTEAVKPLAVHLNDPANTTDDVERTAAALAALGGASVRPELEEFFALYRGTANDEKLENAVVSVAQALAKAGGKDVVKNALTDGATLPSLLPRLTPIASDPSPSAGEKKPEGTPAPPPVK